MDHKATSNNGACHRAMQVPLVALTMFLRKALKTDALGNYFLWLVFCFVGQPMMFAMYYHDWLVAHKGNAALMSH